MKHAFKSKIIYGNDYGINGWSSVRQDCSYLFKNQEIAKRLLY